MQRWAATFAALAVFAHGTPAQDAPKVDTSQWQVRVKPDHVTMKIGDKVKLEAEVVDVAGRPVKATGANTTNAHPDIRWIWRM